MWWDVWLVGIGALCNVKSDCLCVEQCFPVTVCVDFDKLIETDSLAPTFCKMLLFACRCRWVTKQRPRRRTIPLGSLCTSNMAARLQFRGEMRKWCLICAMLLCYPDIDVSRWLVCLNNSWRSQCREILEHCCFNLTSTVKICCLFFFGWVRLNCLWFLKMPVTRF